ncbi:MAG: mevalonate kinase [Candidatus Aenigmatarchaeota archaeon]|nr:MAG: mevalonate kinase [Candidatus Aenigmarchaeota archaeon]
MSEGQGFGKVILFGEHFVVYGLPAIASGIDKLVKARVERNEKGIIFDDRVFNSIISFEKQRDHVLSKTFEKVFGYFGVKDIKIEISGDVVPMAGMGYSAALAVAVIRALNEFTGKGVSEEEVNKLAYECEKVSHGTPSGIDNTCATYGKILWFEKNMEGGENTIEPIEMKGNLLLVMGNTGKKGNTKELVAKVRKRKESEPDKYGGIFSRAGELVKHAKERMISFDLKGVGELMNENHSLLQEMGVSSPELDKLCELAKSNGALGAKLTGAGGGGFMIAITENEEVQERVAKSFEREGADSFRIRIGV